MVYKFIPPAGGRNAFKLMVPPEVAAANWLSELPLIASKMLLKADAPKFAAVAHVRIVDALLSLAWLPVGM